MYKVTQGLASSDINRFSVKNNPFFNGKSLAIKNNLPQDTFVNESKGKSGKDTQIEKAKKQDSVSSLFVGMEDFITNMRESTGGLIGTYTDTILKNINIESKNNNAELEKQLLKELDSTDNRQLKTAIALLGKLDSSDAIEKMQEMLSKNSTDVGVAAEIINALSTTKNSRVAQPIIDLMENTSKDEQLRTLCAIALGKMKNRKASKPLFEVLRNQEDSPMVRAYAAFSLSEFPTIRNTEQLVRSLADSSELVRANAVMALGIIGEKENASEVVKLLTDPSSMVKANAALTLGNLKADFAVDNLIDALEDTDTNVVVSVARALNHIGNKKSVDKLVKVLENTNNTIILRRNVGACLQLMQDKKSINALNRIVAEKSEDITLRNYALSALTKMKATEAIDNYMNILDDPDEDFKLKINAAAGIGLLGKACYIQSLIKIASETEIADLKNNCVNAIRVIVARALDKSEVNDKALLPLLKDENETIKAMVSESLGVIKSKNAVKELVNIVNNTEEKTIARMYAIGALGSIGDQKVVPALLDILKNDPEHKLRSKAASAIYMLGKKNELFDIVKNKNEGYEVRKHAAGCLISMGEKSELLQTFLKPALNVKKLHDNNIKGQGVEVAVIDDSIDPEHAEFDGRLILEPLEHHGTMVSGNLGGNLSGVAPKVTIHAYNAYENKNVDEILEKIVDQKIKGENNIKVVNISLGYNPKLVSDPAVQKIINRFDQVANMAKRLGITVVVAAGNDGKDMPVPQFGTLNLLCLSDSIISVGATQVNSTPDYSDDDTRADFSSYPGEDCLRQLDVMAPGFEITLPFVGGSYKVVDGTSFAAPFVAGLASLMYQVIPDITPDQVLTILKDTSDKLNDIPLYMQGAGQVNPLYAVVKAVAMS
ncbi:MAG: HEAT repeat domain-containing protein, partial [Vampirovibrionia bacterium]